MEVKKITLLALFILCMGLMLGACSEKSFTAADGSVFQKCVKDRPEVTCKPVCDANDKCVDAYDYTITVNSQVKDILFVVDVSGSMSEEQARMGSMFPNFLNTLANVDYRIAITTTDVRDRLDIRDNLNLPDNANGRGAFQNGNLVPFNDGSPFLSGALPLLTEQRFFEDTIKWEQTLTCERNNYVDEHCPSGDERAILAAAMTFEKNPSHFIRPIGHMAVVILSDEDEGSSGILVEPEREEPENFIGYFKGLYPNKSITVHSIIVEPGTSAGRQCFSDQERAGHPSGAYGTVYAELSSRTARAVIGDICANDANYSDQLKDIAESVSLAREPIPCDPINGEVQVDFIPDPGYPVEVIKNLSQNEILFSEALPKDTKIRFRYSCDNN